MRNINQGLFYCVVLAGMSQAVHAKAENIAASV